MARRFIQSSELLDLADELAGRAAGPGKPRTIALRRSISTAYYALFHKLCQHAASRLLGNGDWTDTHAMAGRWIAHTDLAALADAANGRGNRALVKVMEPVDPALADLAENFLDLQSARHDADYNDYFDVSKQSTLSYIDAARNSVRTAENLYETNNKSYQRFVGMAMGAVKIAKSR